MVIVITTCPVLWVQGTVPQGAKKDGLGHTVQNVWMGFTTSVVTVCVVSVLMVKLAKNMKGAV